ncbi:MAG: HlyD family efflux transporter periplasmic adaptor subunit [Planctomycetaceae bacterium]|nr:HlyD family efflux transporter periplasmic adaptor subunit [Planctomycetaceae bacterium]
MTYSSRTRQFLAQNVRKLALLSSVVVALLVMTLPLLSEAPEESLLGPTGNVIQTAQVEKAPFRQTIDTRGEIDSQEKSTLASEVDERTTILWLIPAGDEVAEPLLSPVDGVVKTVRHTSEKSSVIVVEDRDGEAHRFTYQKQNPSSEVVVTPGEEIRRREILAGDVVCRLDPTELEKDEQKYEIRVNDFYAQYQKAIKDVEIRQTINESNNSQAELNAHLAELDLKKYQEGTYPQQVEQLEGNLQSSKEDLTRAEESLEFTERLASKGYKTIDDVEKERLKVLKLENTVANQERSQQVMEDFTHERKLLELTERAEHLKRHAKRVRLAGEASMAQLRAFLASRERVYNIYLRRLNWIRDQIKACTLVAPQAGEVVYANNSSSRSPEMIEEGSVVRERQKIIHLPNLAKMQVEARIHESMIAQIREGLPATVLIDSLPNEIFPCRLSELSALPVPGRRPNYDQKEYIAKFHIDIPDHLSEELRPGMSAQVEVLVDEIDEPVTQVPVDAVVQTGHKYFVWVPFGESFLRKEITVVHSNDESFVIRDGVSAGDDVILKPFNHFPDEIASLREQYRNEPVADENWRVEELAKEDDIPQSEEEFFAMIGYLPEAETVQEDPSEEVSAKNSDDVHSEARVTSTTSVQSSEGD